ncbi:anti-anti-sigma regulatory factor [Luteibacter rhizovicinus]|uniref:Anti-anti-sigma regulatory factor n=1 Tax=Luteibacter rhizovicinus TaxID=242606 RepID=A0A4R3YUJ4_9GAMM|nr:STAS domain-containing protein [Luteibacter rhizovicinus]TCV94873.1 anti-anti-sigma regulatory factor [Luteibacter rhizovicinus]
MAKKTSGDKAPAAVVLDADLRIGAAPALRDILLTALASGKPVQIDGAGVTHVDTAGLQLLAAFSRDARARDLAPVWLAASDSLHKGVATLGLHELIELPARAGVN